jgi:molybdenum cofactor cytidylyltransferase
MIYAIILAAGASERMGKPKMLLPYRGKSIVEHVIDQVSQAGIDNVLVVLGKYRKAIKRLLKRYPVQFTVNDHYKEGMLSSVQKGFASLPAGVKAAMICLGDQPSIPCYVHNQLIDAYQHGKGVILPVHGGRRGHPVLIDMKYKEEIFALPAEKGLVELMRRHAEDIAEVKVDTPLIHRDVDTPEDYERMLTSMD